MMIARKYLISGEVQGVGYRYFTQRSSARHQVRGYVRNLDDGRVEVVAEGQPESIKGFHGDLAAGPSGARVRLIEELVLDPSGRYPNFRIER